MKVAVIGGGLAGCSLAYVLKEAGAQPIIYEAASELAPGASGHALGLYNPRFTAQRNAQSDFYVSAYSMAVRYFAHMADIDWTPCGALHLLCDEKKNTRYPQTFKNWRWEPEHMRLLDQDAASDVAGIELKHAALYLPDSGYVSPKKLCGRYAKGVETVFNMKVEDLQMIEADAVVLACGWHAKKFADWLGLSTVRGQITDVIATPYSKKLKTCLCYGGYMSPMGEGRSHVVGATFQRWLTHTESLTEDNDENLSKLWDVSPKLAEDLKVCGHRAALRTTSKDHFPLVGKMPGVKNLYISAGHGSHGIISTLMSAYLLADMMLDRPFCLPRRTVEALRPERFAS